MAIYLVRHTQVDIQEGICYGQTDVPLCFKNFKKNCSEIINKLPKQPSAIYSSDLIRCSHLAHECFPNFNIILDKRLREINFGHWELKKWNEINIKDLEQWSQDLVNYKPGGLESLKELFERAESFINSLSLKKDSKMVIFTHAGWIKAALSHMFKSDLKKCIQYKTKFGEVITIPSSTFK